MLAIIRTDIELLVYPDLYDSKELNRARLQSMDKEAIIDMVAADRAKKIIENLKDMYPTKAVRLTNLNPNYTLARLHELIMTGYKRTSTNKYKNVYPPSVRLAAALGEYTVATIERVDSIDWDNINWKERIKQ